MSRRRPFWRDNVLHVPTSPFMSPASSPVPSPAHSPLVSPPHTPTHFYEAPDVANIILNAIDTSASLSLDDILTTFTENAVNVEDAEDAEDAEDVEGAAEEELLPVSEEIDASVQRAYDRFVAELHRAAGHATQNLFEMSRNSPPPANTRPPRRSPPPPPPRARRRNAVFAQRPPSLQIPRTRHGIAVPLPSGGFTFSRAARSPIVIRHGANNGAARNLRRVRSRADLPLLRQYAAEATAQSRERAHRRIVRFSRQLVQRDDRPASPLLSPRGISSFQLTEDFGAPLDKCAICLEDYRVGQRVSFVSCQPLDSSKDHLFHSECIDSWILSLRRNGSTSRTCPVCRGVF